MALKIKIGQSAYDALPEDIKKEYKKTGDDYTLDLTDYEDPAELRRAKEHEKQAAAEAKREAAAEKKRADTAEGKVKDLEKNGASVDDAVKAKDQEWRQKYDTDIAAKDGAYNGLKTAVVTARKNDLATGLANKISKSPSLIAPILASRIDVEIDEKTNEIKHFILGSDGKRSASTLDDLEKESLKNKEWAPILRGTQGSGGGGAPNNPGGGGAPRSQQTPQSPGRPADDLTKLSGSDFAARIREQREAEGRT